jgi:hypothetical protein
VSAPDIRFPQKSENQEQSERLKLILIDAPQAIPTKYAWNFVEI